MHPQLMAKLVFYHEKLTFEKVGVNIYFCLFLKIKQNKKKTPKSDSYLKEKHVCQKLNLDFGV